MAVELLIEPHPTYLLAVVKGVCSPTESRNVIPEVMKACTRHHLPLVLIDWRQMTLTAQVTMVNRFEFASFLADQVIRVRARGLTGIRVACVADETYLDPGRFGETVAINRGVELKVTSDMAEALAWLGVEPANDGHHAADGP